MTIPSQQALPLGQAVLRLDQTFATPLLSSWLKFAQSKLSFVNFEGKSLEHVRRVTFVCVLSGANPALACGKRIPGETDLARVFTKYSFSV